jgi:hypothetical protein
MNFCPDCGTQLSETDNFCGNCGTKNGLPTVDLAQKYGRRRGVRISVSLSPACSWLYSRHHHCFESPELDSSSKSETGGRFNRESYLRHSHRVRAGNGPLSQSKKCFSCGPTRLVASGHMVHLLFFYRRSPAFRTAFLSAWA